jgi:DNA-binding CsgD family transcriptional regulator
MMMMMMRRRRRRRSAGRLYLSPLTSKTHVSRIMTKLNARDRAQLVVIAYESGLVTPGQRTQPSPSTRSASGSSS